MHPSGEAVRSIERARVDADHGIVDSVELSIANTYAQLAIADAIAELNRTLHDCLATGFISIEVRDDS